MSSTATIEIASVQVHEVGDVVDFVMAARAQLFPMLDAAVLPADLQRFDDIYLAAVDGHFWLARCCSEIIATIGYRPYNHRFAQLDYAGRRVVEIVSLFVAPAFRRCGLAARLCSHLREHASRQGVEVLYLHTHPFLPGAIRFWETQGFVVTDIESDPVWQTTHMQYRLADLS